jgi:SpoVK/Ycf46/Vps4 family AAA+-type ATPase
VNIDVIVKVKRIYVPLPEKQSRVQMIRHLLKKENNVQISDKELDKIAELTEGIHCII